MKKYISIFIIHTLLLSFMFSSIALADGDGNIDHGGGGMGDGTNENYWSVGEEGVRVTVIKASERIAVTTPVDFANVKPNISVHFGKISKLSYTSGRELVAVTTKYKAKKPDKAIPKIISSNSGQASIEEIKKYFCSEYMVMTIANATGMDYDILINGQYKLLLEPIAYFTFGGIKYAMTATEAALFDQKLGGGLRSKMVSLSHKNLPLAMFLETPDLGYPAWSGSTTTTASDTDIIASLGIGIVRFKDAETEPPDIDTTNYEYRVNTDVITSVTVQGGQADPNHPVIVKFQIGGQSYTVSGVYYPEGDSQLVWVRWRTPSTPQTMTIHVSVSGSGASCQGTLTAKIVDLSGKNPPNPLPDDRNDSFTAPSIPSKAEKTSASWGVWRPYWYAVWVWHSNMKWIEDPDENGEDESGHWVDEGRWVDEGYWKFDWISYSADITATMSVVPDSKNPTASGDLMKSGYGINQSVTAHVSANQSSAVTQAQTAVSYFPEFKYKTYWRLLEQTQSGYNAKFEFASNKYSTYKRRTHFTPIWMPDGIYTVYNWLADCWTPAGMLSMNLTDSVIIQGNLWADWHIGPQKPD